MKEKSKNYKKTNSKNGKSLEEYKKQVAERLSQLTPILQRVSMGDFSENIVVPEKEDEFTELIVSLNLMVDDLRGFKGLEEYKKQTAERFSQLTPILQKVAVGDFSENVVIPEKEDEFTELLASINLMVDDLKEFTEMQKKAKEEVEKKVTERTKELKRRTDELENSRRALVNMIEDVSESREKIEEEKNKTLAIITNFSDGLLVIDLQGKLSLINPQAEKTLEVRAKNVEGKKIVDLSVYPFAKLIVDLLGEEIKEVFRQEIEIKKDLVLEATTIPMTQSDEKFGTLVILHDITREKLIEKMKTEFVSLSAHQLRTPLSAIKWTLKMLLDGDLGKITDEQRSFIEKTYISNERMINLINDLLNVTRIEEGKYIYKPQPTQLENVVQFVVNSYKDEFAKKNLKCIFNEPTEKFPLVKIDVEKIRLVVQNFIENALRYTPAGGEVTISLKCDKREVEVSVHDTGLGIPVDQQERIFTKFFRATNAMRVDTEGSGLGLFISKNIIDAHNGRIWFKSEEGKGTTFSFALPCVLSGEGLV